MSLFMVFAILVATSGVAWASTIEQVYPAMASYSCISPSIKLQCTVYAKPLSTSWNVDNSALNAPEQVTAFTPGHIVDKSKLQNGTLYLEVNNTVYSKGNSYICTAVYSSGETEVSAHYLIPVVEDINATIRNLSIEPMQSTLYVKWDHDYYLCRRFTVYLNGSAVPECTNITALNCTIKNLNYGVQYLVQVVATESDTEPIKTPQTAIVLKTSSASYTLPGLCIWALPLVATIVPHFGNMFW